MKQFLTELFAYNKAMNALFIDQFYEHPQKAPERAVLLMDHILNAHHIWISRINYEALKMGGWDSNPRGQWNSLNQHYHLQTDKVMGFKDLGGIIQYKNLKGQAFSNSILDILYHIVNHSNYHRAQIATLFRNSDIEPARTDYILYKR